MRRIRDRDTKPELLLRRELYARGKRYRLHVRDLPGKPDLAFRRYRLVVFVHGCFWHQHFGCIEASRPKSNGAYWSAKLKANVERDSEQARTLAQLGYRVLVLWECEIEASPSAAADRVEALLLPESATQMA